MGALFVWKSEVLDAGLRIFRVTPVLRVENLIPDTEQRSEVTVLVLGQVGVMHTVGLGRNKEVSQRSQVGAYVAVIKAGVPVCHERETEHDRSFDRENQERNDQNGMADKIFKTMVPKIAEKVYPILRMMERMKFPQPGNFVIEVMLQPIEKIQQ